MTDALLAAAIALPLVLLLACASSTLRPLLPSLLPFAPTPALAAALFGQKGEMLTLGVGRAALRFALDLPGAMFLGTAAVLWLCAGIYASQTMREHPKTEGLLVCWLMTLTGCVGVFLAADLIGFYFLLAVLSVGASGLVLQGEWPQAIRASATYLGIALLAESILLVGLVLLAQSEPNGSLLIRDAVVALLNSPWRDTILLLLLTGLGIKAGLVPLHFWMPLAYDAAPIPAAAVMSGAVIKASALAMIRFLPPGLPEFGHTLTTLGLLSAFYGVAIGLTQLRPQVILAYSSVSQMGFLVALIGSGIAESKSEMALAASFYGAHHLLVKGALFLAVGATMRTSRRHLALTIVPAAIIALGLAGLPFTGGALAKDAAKDLMGGGFIGVAATSSSIATSLLMVHFLKQLRLTTIVDRDARAPAAITIAWLSAALASIVVPWLLYLSIPIDALSDVISPAALWSALWPVLIGAALAFVLDRTGARLPRTPAGDVGAAMIPLRPIAIAAGRFADHIEAFVRRWSVSVIALLLVALVFGWSARAT